MKQGDIVGNPKEIWQGKVTWVDEEKGECGVVYIEPENYRGGGQVYQIAELKIIGRATPKEMKHIDEMSVDELRAEVQRLRNQPRRAVSQNKAKSKDKILADKLKGLSLKELEKLVEE